MNAVDFQVGAFCDALNPGGNPLRLRAVSVGK
jgi:hypothetical protein